MELLISLFLIFGVSSFLMWEWEQTSTKRSQKSFIETWELAWNEENQENER